MQRQCSFARHELAPSRRLELEFETKHIAVELHGFAHVGDKLDHVPKLRSLHLTPPLDVSALITPIECSVIRRKCLVKFRLGLAYSASASEIKGLTIVRKVPFGPTISRVGTGMARRRTEPLART